MMYLSSPEHSCVHGITSCPRPRYQTHLPVSLCQVDVKLLVLIDLLLWNSIFCYIFQKFISILVHVCSKSLACSCFKVFKRSYCCCYSIKLFPVTWLSLLTRLIYFMVTLDSVKQLSAEFLRHSCYC